MSSREVLIIGASARAAAWSARRAGLNPIAVDLFGDFDLRQIATTFVTPHNDWPRGAVATACALTPTLCLYTGALENHPELLEQLASRHSLLGNPSSVVRKVRDPLALTNLLRRNRIEVPDVAIDHIGLPRNGSWLLKPIASASGWGVRLWEGSIDPPTYPHYFQRRIQGANRSAIFLANQRTCKLRLIGVSAQLTGRAGSPFAYRGNIGPLRITASLRARLLRLGRTLAREFELAGLFGVDFIQRDQVPYPVEVNPRYTASVEVHELATGMPLLVDHIEACIGHDLTEQRPRQRQPADPVVGKWIVTAPCACEFDSRRARLAANDERPESFPFHADIPAAGTTFRTGEPVLTLLERAADARSCLSRLKTRAARWSRRLRTCEPFKSS